MTAQRHSTIGGIGAAVAPGCGQCDGRGYHRKESAVFGTTYRVNYRACRGTGVEPCRWAA